MPRADGAALLKRFEQLKSRRSVIEEDWRQCYALSYPLRGVGFETMGTLPADPGQQHASTARTRQAELLDGTGTDAAKILASALMSGLTPANSRWPGLEVDQMSEEERRWLDNAAEVMWLNIHASNYDAVGFDCMLDMVIAGMFPMFVEEDPEGGYRFEEWPLANTYFTASTPGGPVDGAWNEFQVSAEQAANTYGEAVSDKVREMAAAKPDEMVRFLRCVYPRPGPHGRFALNLPIASVHIEFDTKAVVRESGYHELPLGVPRWSPLPGSVYAFGPVKEALPDLKTLNETVKYDLANMDLAVSGMYGAVDDGVLNPRTVRVGPRKVIVMAAKDNFWPISPSGKFEVGALEIDRLQRAIRKIMMADQLEPVKKEGTPVSATEIVVRVELIRQLLGPVYGRMQSEYLQWLIKRCFGIGLRAGAFGTPPRSLMQKLIRVQYFSPLARAQKAVDVAAMDRYELTLAQQAALKGEDVLDNYKWDEADRKRAELLGVPADLIPDEDEIAELRKRRTDATLQAKRLEMAQEALGKQPRAA